MSYDPKEMAFAGYGSLMDVDVRLFSIPGMHVVETITRNSPEWANWVIPIWFFRVEATTVCSVSPTYRDVADKTITLLDSDSPLALNLSREVTALTVSGEWTLREILIFPSDNAPEVAHPLEVVRLTDGHGPHASSLLRIFDGGVFAIVDDGQVVSHAGIKNKRVIQEIAVGTLPEWQGRGLAKAVVAEAIRDILKQEKVAVYIPDTLSNAASYALARSLGFEKFAETLQWAFELDS